MLLFGIGVAAFAIFCAWLSGLPPALNKVRSPARVGSALEFLLRRGLEDGSVRFQVDADPTRAVVFSKYIVSHGDVGITGSCTQGTERDMNFDALRQDLLDRGMPHTLTHTAGRRTIEMACGRDVGLGAMLVLLAFQRMFEVNLGEHCVAVFENTLDVDAPKFTGVDPGPPSS